MATYAGKDAIITVGGTALVFLSIAGIEEDMAVEDTTPIGVATRSYTSASLKEYKPWVITALYNDTASTGFDALLGPATLGTTVACVITLGGTKTITGSAIVKNYKREPVVGKVTRATATLQPTGTQTEA